MSCPEAAAEVLEVRSGPPPIPEARGSGDIAPNVGCLAVGQNKQSASAESPVHDVVAGSTPGRTTTSRWPVGQGEARDAEGSGTSSGLNGTADRTPFSTTYGWASQGACQTTDPDTLFVRGAAQNRAKAICMSCVVRTECLADALDNRIEFGVWGGMTERERRALLRRRPTVESWRRLLEAARMEHERMLKTAGRTASAG